jgi:hypothetical protein
MEVKADDKPFGPEDIIEAGPASASEPQPQAVDAAAAPGQASNGSAEPKETAVAEDKPPQKKPDPRITEEDRDAYQRHVLGARFLKRYTVSAGSLSVVLQSRTVAENDEIYRALDEDVRKGELTSNASALIYLLKMYRYYMATSVVEYSVGGRTIVPVGKTMRERHDWFRDNLNEAQLRLILRCQEEFEYLVGALYEEAVSPDFTRLRVGVS